MSGRKTGALLTLSAAIWLISLAALGETAVTIAPDAPAAGEAVLIDVSHPQTDVFSYVLMLGADTLGSADEVREDRLTFVPGEEGDYLLRVIPAGFEKDTVTVTIPVSPRPAGAKEPAFTLYGQKDGSWALVPYGGSTLSYSGCAIFALSHALQRLGYQGDQIRPENLAARYSAYLGVNGTRNGAMISRAAADFGFRTNKTLYTSKSAILKKFAAGAVFSFGIVDQHIALADGIDGSGTMCHIVDSSPSSTFRYIKGVLPSWYDEQTGAYVEAQSPRDLPGVRYSLPGRDYTGAEYWLPLSYLCKRGLRLIEPR